MDNLLEKENHKGKPMSYYLDETITHLCNSPYIDRERLEADQVPVVKQILKSYLSDKKSFILEAPTGVGKSIIGIMVSDAISRYMGYHNSSPSTYMLTSSKMLQDQLDEDKDRFKIKWAVLKGQVNYGCHVNGKNFTQRDCKNMSISKAEKDLECAATCPYIIARNKAKYWDTAILSYAYWLTTMNYVYEFLGSYAPFQKRHVTIFDEAHMLSDIVCNMFSTEITSKIIGVIRRYKDTFNNILPKSEDALLLSEITEEIVRLIPLLLNEKLSVQQVFDYLIEYDEVLIKLNKHIVSTRNRYLSTDSKLWSKEQRKFDKDSESMQSYCVGVDYFIKENKDNIGMVVKTYEKEIDDRNGSEDTKMLLRSLLEQNIIKEHCHKYTDFSLFMSATIGDADIFAQNNGIENYDYLYIDSNFKFDNSPILQVGPPISLAFKEKHASMPELMLRIEHICNNIHPDEKGIIHTGNFEIAFKFKEFLWEQKIPNYRRFLFYKSAQEKDKAIVQLAKSKNAVIIGPSLMEGLDLKDDLARFSILAKVPYPALDSYNRKKMEIMPSWYNWKTTTSIMQSMGRTIRHKNDWAYTYLLDSCFDLVFRYNRIPDYISRRFGKMPLGMLNQQKTMDEADAMGLFNYENSGTSTTNEVKPPKDKWEMDLEYYRKHGVMPGDDKSKSKSKTKSDPLFANKSEDPKYPYMKDTDDLFDDLPF